jgi:polyhydroxyalkanoate synthesis regulator phasin
VRCIIYNFTQYKITSHNTLAMASKKNNQGKTNLVERGEKARDLFYAGVGYAAHAKERVAELVEELKKQGKISKPEGEKIVKDFISDTKKARDKFEDDVKNAVNEVVEKASYASQKELDVLKKRLLELEAKGLDAVKNVVERATAKGKEILNSSPSAKKAPAKAKAAAKTVKATVKKVSAAKTPVKKVAAAKTGAKTVAKQVAPNAVKAVNKAVSKASAKPAAKKVTPKSTAAPANKKAE